MNDFWVIISVTICIIGFFICLFALIQRNRANISNERKKKVRKLVEVAVDCSTNRNFAVLPTGLQKWLLYVPMNGDYAEKIRINTKRWAQKHYSEVYFWYDNCLDRDGVPHGSQIIAA